MFNFIGYINYPEWIRPEIFYFLDIPLISFLRWYSLSYILAFSTAYFIIMTYIKRNNLEKEYTKEHIEDLFWYGILCILLGARLFSALFYTPSGLYYQKPWLIFLPFDSNWNFVGFQGMSFHGGALGLVIAAIIFRRKYSNLDILNLIDIVAFAVPFGHFWGRMGNFMNAELYGRITQNPLGMLFPNASHYSTSSPWVVEFANNLGIDATESLVNLPRHPSQLYQAFGEGILLGIILYLINKHKPYKGFVAASYFVGYGFFRFITEYLRAPDNDLGFVINLVPINNPSDFSYLNITMGQILSLVSIVCGLIGMYIIGQQKFQISKIQKGSK